MKIGEKVTDFVLQNQNGKEVSLKSFKGKWIVLYFYPKDNTSGCTVEAQDFTKLKNDFTAEDAVILGVSKDSVKSHKSFESKKELNITLLSNTELDVLKVYEAWGLKKMYGKEYEGTVRTTYLITPDFKVGYLWKKVRAKGHAEEVLEKLQEF